MEKCKDCGDISRETYKNDKGEVVCDDCIDKYIDSVSDEDIEYMKYII